jgi:hypothetical protein
MTDIYLVITEDRHADTEVTPFASPDEAVAFAGQQVVDNARHPEDITGEAGGGYLIAPDGWIWYCRYSSEGDSVRVVRCALRGAPPAR